jgi:hypothetical protein
MEELARCGDSPPYHVHHTEDEVFHLIENELVLLVDGKTRRVHVGETQLAPSGVPHTYRVVSEQARWLVVTARGDFERFVREVARLRRRPSCLPPLAHRRPSSGARSPSSRFATASSCSACPSPQRSPRRHGARQLACTRRHAARKEEAWDNVH